MLAELKHTLGRMRGQMIGWGIGLALYGLLLIWFYDSIAGMENLQQFLQNYPEEMTAFFKSMTELNTPKGYLDTYYFSYMTLIIAILPITSPMLVSDDNPESPVPSDGVPFNYSDPNFDFPGYMNAVSAKLNTAAPETFSPTMTTLDALIQSIQVTP